MNIDELFERLTKLNINITAREISAIWGMDEASFSRKKRTGSEIKYRNIKQLEQELNINLTEEPEKALNDFIDLPVRGDVSASMGTGLTVYDERQTGVYKVNPQLLRDIGANSKYSEVIFARGDSMLPTIEGGDSLIVDFSKREIYDGKIFVVRINNQLYAKRLQFLPPHTVSVISDNPKYQPFNVDLSKELDYDFEVIGEVLYWGRVAR